MRRADDMRVRNRRPGAGSARRAGFRGIGGGGGGGSDPSLWSVDYSQLTVTRNTEATLLTGAPSSSQFMRVAAPNAPRYEDRGDGAGPLLLIEGLREATNALSQALDGATWGTLGAMADSTPVANYAIGPLGRGAVRLATPTGTNRRQQTRAAVTTVPQAISAWARAAVGSSAHISAFAGGSAIVAAGDAALTSTWKRISALLTTYVSGGTSYYIQESVARNTVGGLAAGPRDSVIDLYQAEVGRFPSSAIRTRAKSSAFNTPRYADTIVGTSAQVPAGIFSGPGRLSQFSPVSSSAEMASGEERWLLSIDGNQSGIRIRHTGTNIVLEALAAGVVVASLTLGAWAAHALLGALTWDPGAGTVGLGGVTSAPGSSWSWTPGNVRVGGIYGGTGEVWARLGALTAPGGAATLGTTPEAIDVMWWGDSLTCGTLATLAQWRKVVGEIDAALPHYQRRYNPIGFWQNANPAFDNDWSMSVGGAQVSTLTGWFSAWNLATLGLTPAIAPICIGTNNLGTGGQNPTDLAPLVGGLIDLIAAAWPGVLIPLQKLPPRFDAAASKVVDWNANFHDVVVADAVTRGHNVISDDTLATACAAATYADLLHPDAASAPAIGAAMHAAYQEWAALL
ncbi:hypothetical protein [Sandaracinus amylolyticus]|uniref:hypothetical protein n=1 Tax=Sandaracinus amylolyticus TaxID=927083 RepID=UPI001F42F0C5|nr:hypothetical protein [Sandaracinus amylolyticus]UJR81500.1 Hypothetical protein I5071_35600 [Sandaracinus amylolyticus]